jgi:NAD(P)-dependent dehydrogenase (short-subunit alcohol dehydrogenase family)
MRDLKNSKDNYFESVEDYDDSLWEKALLGNLNTTFYITQLIGKQMKKAKYGKILNIASDVGVISPDHRIYEENELYNYKGVNFNTPISYSVAKSGIISLTRYLATRWAPYNINVNSVSPAGIYNNQDKKFVEQLSSRIPLGRMARVNEIVLPSIFLCTEAANFITGANIMIDGGRTAW